MATPAAKAEHAAHGDGGLPPRARRAVAERLEHFEAVDAVAEPAQKGVQRLVPPQTRAKDVLSGTWLGHPLHPVLTDVVIGSWVGAAVLDLAGGDDDADRLIALGIAAAAPTALAGLSDWAELRGGPRRVGVVHALGNTTALALYLVSLRARRRGRRRTGVLLSTAGMAASIFSAWLGGHLSFGRGVGVNQTAFEEAPRAWTPVTAEDDVRDGQLVSGTADGVGVLVVRHGQELHALLDRCCHRGCSLGEGSLDGEIVTCPCHGSRFRLDGSLVKGPATAPQPVLDVRIRNGRVEVRAPERD